MPNVEYKQIFQFNLKSKIVCVETGSMLKVLIEGKVLFSEFVKAVEFSHFEVEGNVCCVYFLGERDYVVVIKNDELVFAGYCDECNINTDEKYFLHKLKDNLNHGRVCRVNKNKVETYLVYLDEDDLNLKDEFVCGVFLDCLKAGNLEYCNHLLCEELKMQNKNDIKTFFPEFDYFYLLEQNVVVLINKKALAGIFEFYVENNQIVNIKEC